MAKFKTKQVRISKSGQDGNAFTVLGLCASALRKAGASEEDVRNYLADATSGNYEHLLAVSAEWCNFKATR